MPGENLKTDENGDVKPGPGRPKGSPNKATLRAREAIAKLLDDNSDRLQEWLEEIYGAKGAEAAFKCMVDLMEFGVPKLSRSDIHATVDNTVHIHTTPPDVAL